MKLLWALRKPHANSQDTYHLSQQEGRVLQDCMIQQLCVIGIQLLVSFCPMSLALVSFLNLFSSVLYDYYQQKLGLCTPLLTSLGLRKGTALSSFMEEQSLTAV